MFASLIKFSDSLPHNLWDYDKSKVILLKTILTLVVILHHIYNEGFSTIGFVGAIGGNIAMYLFFAMSGYGLTISYLRNEKYIFGFLQRSLTKLYIPYVIALIAFVIYRYAEGIDQIALLKVKGLLSFVPTSWFIWVLSIFYIFFFVVFRYVKASNFTKVLLTCALVMAYVLIAPYLGFESHRYNRCPSFCVGMFFALYNDPIKKKNVRWHAWLVLIFLLALLGLRVAHCLDPIIYPIALFVLMYIFKGGKELRITKFLSSISMEMFIIQFLPIYIAVNDLHLTSTLKVVVFVLVVDVMLAYAMHLLVKAIMRYKNNVFVKL